MKSPDGTTTPIIESIPELEYRVSSASRQPLYWIGSSRKDLLAFPVVVRRAAGHALDCAQCGGRHPSAKPLSGFGSAAVVQFACDGEGGTFRVVYLIGVSLAVFVLHGFQKKSHRGIATARTDIDIIHARLRVARRLDRELASGETQH